MLLPIVLGIKRGVARANDEFVEHADAAFIAVKPRVIRRDNSTCRYSGLRLSGKAAPFLHVHHVDHDHHHNDETNLVCAEALSHWCHHLGFVGARGLGRLIYIPDATFSQSAFNCLQLLLWKLAADRNIEMRTRATRILRALQLEFSEMSDLVLGKTDPAFHAEVLAHIPNSAYDRRKTSFSQTYLLFDQQAVAAEVGQGVVTSVLEQIADIPSDDAMSFFSQLQT